MISVSELLGKTLVDCRQVDPEIIEFKVSENERYELGHYHLCCESVYIEDVIGDLSDLVGSPILMAEVVSSEEDPVDVELRQHQEHHEWTFYKLATVKGYVTLRWYGTSNGCYSTTADFTKV